MRRSNAKTPTSITSYHSPRSEGPFCLDFSERFGDDCSMTAEQVKKARERAPFKPFTIYLSDQRRFEIRRPDFLWVMPGGRTIGIADEQGAADIVDLVYVTSLKLKGHNQT